MEINEEMFWADGLDHNVYEIVHQGVEVEESAHRKTGSAHHPTVVVLLPVKVTIER
jgi:hypothetical protein